MNARTGVLERDIGTTIGGIESDYWGAWWLNYDMMRNRGWMSYHDWLQYVVVRDVMRDVAAQEAVVVILVAELGGI